MCLKVEDDKEDLEFYWHFYENTLKKIDDTKHIFLKLEQATDGHGAGFTSANLEKTLAKNFISELTNIPAILDRKLQKQLMIGI